MKHRFLVTLFLVSFFFLVKPSLALGACDVVGEPCCSKERTEGGYEGSCENDLQCNIIDNVSFIQGINGPGISECIDVPCGQSGQPCCTNRTCKSSNLECHDALIEGYDYNTICSQKQNPPLASPVFCTPGDETSGISTALGCIKVNSGASLIETILRFATGIGGGLALALILYGVFIVTTSAGSPDKLKQGQEIITSAIVGLIFILLSVFLVNLIGINILGIPGLS